MKVFATYNIKGGVGKTAAAVNLAYLSARSGARTLIWDLDPQGAASFYFRIKPRVKGGSSKILRGKQALAPLIRGTDYHRLDLLPADFSYRNMDVELQKAARRPERRLSRLLAPLAGDYDHIFLDCAPSISVTSESIFAAADVLLVPTIPTTLSMRTLQRILDTVDDKRYGQIHLMPFFSMVDRRKRLHREICAPPHEISADFLETNIPYSSNVEQMGTNRAPLPVFSRSSRSSKAFQALAPFVGMTWNSTKEAPVHRKILELVFHELPSHLLATARCTAPSISKASQSLAPFVGMTWNSTKEAPVHRKILELVLNELMS